MSEIREGTSRSGFLKQAAGAAAVVAGTGVGAGVFAPTAAASYVAGKFSLELDGINCGAIGGVSGGDLDYEVVPEPVGSDGYVHKHIGMPKFEDFTLQVGSNMSKPFYEWVKQSFDHGVVRKSGAIIAADFNHNEIARRGFSTAFISSVTIPALDGSSKDAGYIAVTLSPTKVSDGQPSGQPVDAAKNKAWLLSNFVFEIDGVDTSRIASVDSFTWKCSIAPDGSSQMDVSNIGTTFSSKSLPSWSSWFDAAAKQVPDDRAGRLTLAGAQGGGVLTLGFSGLGCYRIVSPRDAASGLPTGKAKGGTKVSAASWDLATAKGG